MDLHMPYSTVLLQMTLNDLERLSEICNDMKHHADSLRQLSFLFSFCIHQIISLITSTMESMFWRDK